MKRYINNNVDLEFETISSQMIFDLVDVIRNHKIVNVAVYTVPSDHHIMYRFICGDVDFTISKSNGTNEYEIRKGVWLTVVGDYYIYECYRTDLNGFPKYTVDMVYDLLVKINSEIVVECTEVDVWNPTFVWVKDVAECSDEINKPHEDYPVRVDATTVAINKYRNMVTKAPADSQSKIIEVTLEHIFNIHRDIMSTSGVDSVGNLVYPLSDELLGNFRNHSVMVGGDIPPSFDKLPTIINDVLPLKIETRGYFMDVEYGKKCITSKLTDVGISSILKNWYMDFENIHPFSDGNGRVGGVVVAIISSILSDENLYLTPDRK